MIFPKHSLVRQVEKLSNWHRTMVYLSEIPQWHGEGVVVETDGPRSTAIIPDIGLESSSILPAQSVSEHTRAHCAFRIERT